MTDVFICVSLCVITLVLSLFLKQYKAEYALITSLAGCAVIALYLLGNFNDIKYQLENLLKVGQIDTNVLKISFKSLGICYITAFASSFCKDFGFTSLAAKVELCGRITVVMLSLPLIQSITETALELIG